MQLGGTIIQRLKNAGENKGRPIVSERTENGYRGV